MKSPIKQTDQPGSRRRAVEVLAVAVLLAGHYVLGVASWSGKGATYDEMLHITGGYCQWKFGDYRVNFANGNLPSRLAALGLLDMSLREPDRQAEIWRTSEEYSIGGSFFYGVGNDVAAMLSSARRMVGLLSVGLCLLIYLWSRRIFGWKIALLCLLPAALEPAFLSHGFLATSDAAAALFFGLSLYAFWLVCEKITPLRLAVSVTSMGLLMVSKASGPLIAPMALVLIGLRLLKNEPLPVDVLPWRAARPPLGVGSQPGVLMLGTLQIASRSRIALTLLGALAVHAAGCLVIIWAFYGFRYSMFSPDNGPARAAASWQEVLDPNLVGRLVAFARDHKLLPEAYLLGFAHAQHYAGERMAFMNGRYSTTGWWYFFPAAYAMKTPLATLAILALAAAGAIMTAVNRWRPRSQPAAATSWFDNRMLYESLPPAVLLVAYGITATMSHLNIGIRHILPMYAPLLVLGGWCWCWLAGRAGVAAADNSKRRILVFSLSGVLLAALAVAVLSAWPNYLAFFNRGVGGPANGWRHLVDSNCDWGQELPALKAYLRRHPSSEPTYLSYFGIGVPEYYDLKVTLITSHPNSDFEPLPDYRPGRYCFSATMLQNVVTAARGPWTRQYEDVYQKLLVEAKRWAGRANVAPPEAQSALHDLDALRFNRLCTYLRRRNPDDSVNCGLLIYHVTQADLDAALLGPPVECRPDFASPP